MEFTKIRNDVNGNPRYVVHFLNCISQEKQDFFHNLYDLRTVTYMYNTACRDMNKIGGRKYHTKTFGGGIVFSSYSLPKLETAIKNQIIESDKVFFKR